MSQILIKNLSFTYAGASAPVFENVSFSIDTRWKLGFIGRNGKGKTTFLKLLMRQYPFQGSIEASVFFDYFLYFVSKEDEKSTAEELISKSYLSGKKGFILVSHDRDLLDACTDHVLVLNRETIEVQTAVPSLHGRISVRRRRRWSRASKRMRSGWTGASVYLG